MKRNNTVYFYTQEDQKQGDLSSDVSPSGDARPTITPNEPTTSKESDWDLDEQSIVLEQINEQLKEQRQLSTGDAATRHARTEKHHEQTIDDRTA